jgi:hypothetical protein
LIDDFEVRLEGWEHDLDWDEELDGVAEDDTDGDEEHDRLRQPVSVLDDFQQFL